MQRTHLQKYTFRLALLSVAFFLMSCETLQFSNPNSPVVDDVSIQSIITGVEASMRIDWAIYLRVVSIHGREAYYFEPADPRYTGELLNGNPDPGGFLTTRPWTGRYRTIANCRFLLEKNAGPAVDGFAQTIMAYQLLLNLNYMDVNGIKIDYSGDLSIPVADKAQAFAEINRLLDAGNTNLAAAGSAAFPFALSNGFAAFNTPATFMRFNRAIKARVAVYEGKFQDALTALGASFIDPAGPLNFGAYQVYGGGLGDQVNEVYENPDAAFVKWMAHQTFETEAQAGDQRLAQKTHKRTPATTFDNLTSDLAITITASSTDPLPIIRNEELLLLRAEANIGLGQSGPAQADINIVRAAAGLPPVTLGANALDQLLYEKRYALFAEGHRWIDLRRYGRLNTLPTDRAGDVVVAAMPVPETEIPEDGGGR